MVSLERFDLYLFGLGPF